MIEALHGTWADEHIFALDQTLQSWDHYQKLIADCDKRITAVLPPHDDTQPPLPRSTKQTGVNAPEISRLREILAQMCGGRDLTKLPALSHYGVLQLIGEVGTDLSVWPTENTLPPGRDWHRAATIVANAKNGLDAAATEQDRTGQLFCMMAQSLVRSKDIALGGFYRRLAARRGGLVATKALARKLAGWFWRVMVKGDDYVEKGLARYEEQVRKIKEHALKRLANELGRQLVPVPSSSQIT